ncbi:hypothetical protein AB833_11165 [Chromatiales bacterium (ex Bugula neritina AB1)]|nr:hypothetical protein AB833_11165 [Chromatiales bacterium (ex Bugula neritina AB1)]
MSAKLSIIVPAKNESACIRETLLALQPLRQESHQLIVVDGGSSDDTLAVCRGLADIVISSPAGRAVQMNAGAKAALHDILWFVHADTIVLPDGAAKIQHLLGGSGRQAKIWGRCDVQFTNTAMVFMLIAWCMNKRSCLTGIATGDQAIFIRKDAFNSIGGYPEIALMEDIEISRQLKKICRPACLTSKVQTSSRRWEHNGIVRTILLMWKLRLLYFFGVSPVRIARMYRGG